MGQHRVIKKSRFHKNHLLLAGVLIIGIVGGWLAAERFAPPSGIIQDPGVRVSGQYKLVSPLLICASTEPENYGQYGSLESTVNTIIQSDEKAGTLTDASVYFRNFAGRWVDIGSNIQYAPASLLKVPIMIAYYKEAESDPSILDTRLTYDGTNDLNASENFKSPSELQPGTYTVAQLITAMIAHSDNNAESLLSKHMDQSWLSEVYTDLGVQLQPGGSPIAQNITAKQYSYFFRVLYNATYLTPEDSEKALELLTQSDFTEGISASVPSSVAVAQKFGERTLQNQSGQIFDRELHDCGIVYGPSYPYFLCIMTRGNDFNQLESVIQSISKAVYAQVSG